VVDVSSSSAQVLHLSPSFLLSSIYLTLWYNDRYSDEGCALGVGDLRVRIIQADQLPLLDFFPSSADPYLVARLGNYQWRSTTQNNTIEPVWVC
jgi:Ca2+-dependent lipid-binding protein